MRCLHRQLWKLINNYREYYCYFINNMCMHILILTSWYNKLICMHTFLLKDVLFKLWVYFNLSTLRMFDQHLVPHIKWYRNRYWQWDIYTEVVAWNNNTKSYTLLYAMIWPCHSSNTIKLQLSMLQATRHTYSIMNHYLLEQKQNYCVSDHGLWLNSLHVLLVDLKPRKCHTVWRCGRGTILWAWQIYNFTKIWLPRTAGV